MAEKVIKALVDVVGVEIPFLGRVREGEGTELGIKSIELGVPLRARVSSFT